MRYEEVGTYSAVELEDSVFTFEDSRVDRSELIKDFEQRNLGLEWDDLPLILDNYKVFPRGENNNMARVIRGLLKNNPLATRVLKKRLFLTWGRGPALYQETIEETEIKRQWVKNPEIEAWLNSWNYRKYLLKVIEDFNKEEGHWSKVVRDRAHRIGRASKIARIEHIPAAKARLAQAKSKEEEDPDLVIVGEWDSRYQKTLKIYPLLDEENFTAKNVAIHYSHLFTYCVNHYVLPDFLSNGAWMRRSSAIPFILENFTKNNLTIRWHIKIPQAYWDAKERELQSLYKEKGLPYKVQYLIDFKKKRKREIAEVLAGAHNSGKYVTTEVIKEILAERHIVTHEWEFIPIDQKVKDYIDANLAIGKYAAVNISSGLGMHQALSNISSDGKSDSGSEQLYAYRNYNMSEVDVPEYIITDTINRAIEVNWPGSNIRLGFYRPQSVREEDVTPKDRVKNKE